jgi:hypothetical protein
LFAASFQSSESSGGGSMTPQAAPLPPAQRFTASSGAVSILEIVIDEGAAILIEINYAQENVESSVVLHS